MSRRERFSGLIRLLRRLRDSRTREELVGTLRATRDYLDEWAAREDVRR